MTLTTIRTEFDRELTDLNDNLLRLGSMVSAAIALSMQALKERNPALARQVIADDTRINQLRYQIEGDCLAMIARQQPVAGDLRFIIAAMTIVPELERIGDHAAGIAKIAVETGNHPPLKPLIDLPRMAEICRTMLNKSLNAFIKGKKKRAGKIMKMDDEIDRLYEQVLRELLSFMMEDPKTVTRAMYLLFAAHNLERIGDRVTNICERTLFRMTGKIKEAAGGTAAISLDDLLASLEGDDEDDDGEDN